MVDFDKIDASRCLNDALSDGEFIERDKYKPGDMWRDKVIANSYFRYLVENGREFLRQHKLSLMIGSARRQVPQTSPSRRYLDIFS